MGDAMDAVTEVTIDDYSDMTDLAGTVIIAMGAPWCGPWRAFLPTFQSVATSMSGEAVTFLTCDLETNPVIAFLECITRIPSVVIYHDGRRIGKHIGVMSQDDLALAVMAACLTGASDALADDAD